MSRAPAWAAAVVLSLALASDALAASHPLRLSGALEQGGLIVARAAPGVEARLDGRALPVTPEGVFVFGFGRDAGPRARLVVRYADGTEVARVLPIERRRYRVQRIDGLPPRMVTPGPAELARIDAEQRLIDRARAAPITRPYFLSGFAWPVAGRLSGVYGSQRILNGKPRRPHLGVDIAAPEGTLIVAPADGRVTLAHPDLYFTGKTVILHHGLGLSSYLAHMSAILVREGQTVRRGDPVGRVGHTGRATGPHLHWGVNWGSVRVDPALLAGPMSAAGSAGRRPPRKAVQ